MVRANSNFFDRPDTMFGVCEGIGHELGFNANILRMAFGVSLLLSPMVTIGVYAALGAILFASYKLLPNRKVDAPAADVGHHADNDGAVEELAQAA